MEHNQLKCDNQERLEEEVVSESMGKPKADADDVGEDGDGAGVDGEGADISGLLHEAVLGVEANERGEGDDWDRGRVTCIE